MKTKFKVEMHKFGNHTEAIVKMICNHNAGIANVDFDVIMGYLLAKKAQYPSLTDGMVAIKAEYPSIHISDDNGETYYISITECEYEELKPEMPKHDATAN